MTQGRAKEGMATRQGGIQILRNKRKQLQASLKTAKKRHSQENDSVSQKRIDDIERKLRQNFNSINAYEKGYQLTTEEFKKGHNLKMMKGGMYKGKSHNYATGGLVKELKM